MNTQKENHKKGPTTEVIDSLAKAAQSYIKRALGVEIKADEDSLAFIDQYIRDVRKQDLPKPEVLSLVSAALGVHFGEVVLSKLKGRWHENKAENTQDPDDVYPDLNSWYIEITSPPFSFAPIAITMSAFLQEESEDWNTMIATSPELTEPLEDVLAQMSPVTEEYYYSLTGRFENILYVAEILAGIIKNKKDRQNEAKKSNLT